MRIIPMRVNVTTPPAENVRRCILFIGCALIALLAIACSTPMLAHRPPTVLRADGLTEQQAATLDSLEKVDDHPLYTMRYVGAYDTRASLAPARASREAAKQSPRYLESASQRSLAMTKPIWGCSLFAALGDASNMFYGRNFDWEFSPAVLLFTEPPDGYASVAMVDIAYLGFAGDKARGIADLPLAERRALLGAPRLPFDGMNARGLAVGMAAVPPGDTQPDPSKRNIGSLGVIRAILDRASSVEEAVSIFQSYNIDFTGGPPIHYLIADRAGRAVLVEFYRGEMVVMPNTTAWHLATNFLRASVGESAQGMCWRYDALSARLAETRGQLSAPDALALLARVAQPGTQWSVVYGISTGEVVVTMGRKYNRAHTFHLNK